MCVFFSEKQRFSGLFCFLFCFFFLCPDPPENKTSFAGVSLHLGCFDVRLSRQQLSSVREQQKETGEARRQPADAVCHQHQPRKKRPFFCFFFSPAVITEEFRRAGRRPRVRVHQKQTDLSRQRRRAPLDGTVRIQKILNSWCVKADQQPLVIKNVTFEQRFIKEVTSLKPPTSQFRD